MSGEQLERSILERKERDELHAIAEAMAIKPATRSKKSDIIDLILEATGIDVSTDAGRGETDADPSAAGADSPKPGAATRGRANGARRQKAAASEDEPAAGATALAEDRDLSRVTSSAVAATLPGMESADGGLDSFGTDDRGAPAAVADPPEADPPAPTRARRGRKQAAPTEAAAPVELPAATTPETGASDQGPDADETAASGEDRGEPAEGDAERATGRADAGSVSLAGSDAAEVGTSATQTIEGASEAADGNEALLGGSETRLTPSTNGAGHPGASSASPERTTTDRRAQTRPAPAGDGAAAADSRQGATAGAPAQGAPSWQASQLEPGNRRNRRRRGRERERGRDQEPQGEKGGQGDGAWQGELVPVKGLLDLREEGYGFLRTSGYLPSAKDVYVSVSQARRLGLRRGDVIEGACRPASPGEKYPALIRIDSVGGMPSEDARSRPRFEDLTPLFPDERLHLELASDPLNVTARIVDLISPIGKGQRGMIVSPPKAGKTTVLKQIAHSIEANNPDVHLMVLLVDERPEEVTDMRRSVQGEVIASTFDRPADEHTAVAELAIERAKRLVEQGRDVVIVLDGVTRLARAYNLAQPATGRIMSGGVDSGALYPPKKFFGVARNIEEGGSLTILATALVETGSRMDEVIFEEFKGTGNMELRLDRKLSERRIYPSIDVNASSTRHEELLFDRSQLQQVWKLRRVLNALGSEGNAAAGLELLVDKIRTTRSNNEFLAEIAKAPTPTV